MIWQTSIWPYLCRKGLDCMEKFYTKYDASFSRICLCPAELFGSSKPSSTHLWEHGLNENICCCIKFLCCCYLNLWCVSVPFTSAWGLGLWIYSKIWASQAEDSQIKPQAYEAYISVLSHVAEAKLNPSSLGQKPGWTHSQQCQWRLSHSSMYKSLVTNQCWDDIVIK
jgi:hypothetical protein